MLNRIRERLRATVATASCPTFTASFGLVLDAPGKPFRTMVRRADAALLEAKRQGRDRVVFAERTLEELADQDVVARVENAPRLTNH